MAQTHGYIAVDDLKGATVTVTVTDEFGDTPTVFTSRSGSTAQDNPATLTDPAEFHVGRPGDYTVAMTINDVAAGGGSVHLSDGCRAAFSPGVSGTAAAGSGGGGGASEHLGDYATWSHSGAADGTSGSFDYDVDLADSSGSTVGVDDSPEWADPDTGNWGYPTPQVTEAGTYSVLVNVTSGGTGTQLTLEVMQGDGSGDQTPFGQQFTVAVPDGLTTTGTVTGYFPAATHFDITNAAGDFPDALNLTIQRVA
jgi:hypothetical protein